MVLVFIDSNIFLDFSDTNDKDIFNELSKFFCNNNHNSKFCTTDYIRYFEVDKSKLTQELFRKKIVDTINVPEIYMNSPPKNLDLGEWSIYLAIQKSKNSTCCVLCGDKVARDFFEKKNLLPCCHINPPTNGVGGTLGILDHLIGINLLTKEEKEKIISKMKSVGRRLP